MTSSKLIEDFDLLAYPWGSSINDVSVKRDDSAVK
jgi:hypothetical protein